METIRKRVPFRLGDGDLNGAEAENRVLDEQEQEELIDDFRKADVQSRKLNAALARVIIALSAVLHLLYLFHLTDDDPITSLGVLSSSSQPPPLSTLFALIHLALHAALAQRFLPQRFTLRALLLSAQQADLATRLPPSYRALGSAAAIAPLVAIIARCGLSTVVWWSVTGGLVGLMSLIERWDTEGEARIRELEALQYTAKGA